MNATVDLSKFNKQLANFALAINKPVGYALKAQAKLLTRDLYNITPPTKNGKSNKKVGDLAVSGDIQKVFSDLGSTNWKDPYINRLWKAGNYDAVKSALKNHPNKDKLLVFKYKVIPEASKSIHQSARFGQKKRVPRKHKTVYAIAKKGSRKRYTKTIKTHVGKAKSGWLAAMSKLGVKAPSWVTRHGTIGGSIVDDSAIKDNPFIIIKNNQVNISRANLQGTINYRTRIMAREIQRILRGGRHKF